MFCRLIDSGYNDAFSNMAIDEALASHCDGPILRFYEWKPRAVSLGYNQKVSEINSDFCEKNGIDIVRRITGGKAVLHHKELTYSFIVPEKLGLLSKEINESYRKIASALIVGLKNIKIDAQIQKQPDRIATPVCFNSSNWYELTVDGKKVSGSAQRRIGGIILQHGSILVDFDAKANARIFASSSNKVIEKLLNEKITSIKNQTKRTIPMKKIKKSMIEGFREVFGFEFIETKLSEEENALSKKLMKEKYRTKEWNSGSKV